MTWSHDAHAEACDTGHTADTGLPPSRCDDTGVPASPCCEPVAFTLPTEPPRLNEGNPTVMGSFLLPFECVERIPNDESCADAIALVPTVSRPQTALFLWLPGLDNGPSANQHVLHMAAHAGYRTLSVPWDTQAPASERCAIEDAAGTLFLGGECRDDIDCSDVLHDEMLTGIDDPATPPDVGLTWWQAIPYRPGYEGRYASGIERRATRALQALYEADIDDDGVNDHHWDAYCEPDDTHGSRLRWEDVVIAGQSMGATQALHTFYTQPELTRVFTTEGFGDWCEVEFGDAGSGEPSPYYYSDWPNRTFATPPCGRKFTAFHAQSDRWPQQDNPYHQSPQTFEPLGYAFDASSLPHDYDTTGLPIDGEVLITDQVPADVDHNAFHGSMAGDATMPATYSGGYRPDLPGTSGPTGTASVYLFDGYVEGMCSLGDYR